MAGNLSDFAEVEILKWLLNLTPSYTPAATKVALYTVTPDDTGGGTEVTGGSYARTAITWGTPASGAVSNSADITFPTASASWGTVVALAIWDTSGTNMLAWGPLTANKTVGNGDVFKILTGNLALSLD
jgi:hypothetical protein